MKRFDLSSHQKFLTSVISLFACGFLFFFLFDDFVQLMILMILINIVLALSLNLINGLTGQFSLGHAGFMAVGAYFAAFISSLVSKSFPELLTSGAQVFLFPLFTLLGGILAGIAGLIVGLPSLRLKGDYLAIVTLGFGEIIRVILLNTQAVGGARGFYGIPGPAEISIGGFTITKFLMNYFYSSFWVVVCFFVIWRLKFSHYGRSFLSVRDDEIAAEAMGVPTTKIKVFAFAISSFFAGIAGSLFAHHYVNYLNPPSFGFQRSVDIIIMVVLGGMGSLYGSIFAAIIITIVPELLRPLQEYTGVDLRMVIYSLCLILLMILRPQGILGSLELTDFLKKWFPKFFVNSGREAKTQ